MLFKKQRAAQGVALFGGGKPMHRQQQTFEVLGFGEHVAFDKNSLARHPGVQFERIEITQRVDQTIRIAVIGAEIFLRTQRGIVPQQQAQTHQAPFTLQQDGVGCGIFFAQHLHHGIDDLSFGRQKRGWIGRRRVQAVGHGHHALSLVRAKSDALGIGGFFKRALQHTILDRHTQAQRARQAD